MADITQKVRKKRKKRQAGGRKSFTAERIVRVSLLLSTSQDAWVRNQGEIGTVIRGLVDAHMTSVPRGT